MLYPLKFSPPPASRPPGGLQPAEPPGKHMSPGRPGGESRELYDSPPVAGQADWSSSQVVNGPLAGRTLHQIIEDFGRSVHGDIPLAAPHGRFPIQVRFIDARDDSGLRVNTTAAVLYVMQTDAASAAVRRLSRSVDGAQLEQAICKGTVDSLCCQQPVKVGQCIFLPSGTVHALGAGMVVIEIQVAGDGPESLPVAEAMALGKIDCGQAPAGCQRRSHVAGLFTTVTRLVTCEQFTVEKVRFVEGVEEAVPYDQPVVWIMLDGQAEIRVDGLLPPVGFGRGDTLLIPAEMNNPVIKTLNNCVWLEVTFPKKGDTT